MRELYSVLDQGYVKFIESWGSDREIVESARMSTDKSFRGWGSEEKPGDEKFLRFLWENKHYSPFEQAGMMIEVQAPIVVFREWHRHRTQSYNEMSGRYTVLPDMFYVPTIERLKAARQSVKNKQSSELGFDEHQAKEIQETLERAYKEARKRYEILIDAGVAREIARLVLPVAQYSRMRASANLRNWLAFLALRMDKAAQWEIRQYANAVADLLNERFPRTYDLFAEE
jgi:thymidylate synthase (FAD)